MMIRMGKTGLLVAALAAVWTAEAAVRTMEAHLISPSSHANEITVTQVDGGVSIDATAAYAKDTPRIMFGTRSFDVRELHDRDVIFETTLKGPAGVRVNVLIEGQDAKGGHFWREARYTLSGRRRTFRQMHTIPADVNSIHFRFDLVSFARERGPVVWYGSKYGPEPELRRNPPPPGKPELLFHAAFDGTAEATFAKGGRSPVEAKGLAYAPGHEGQAVRLSSKERSRLAYAAADNLNPAEGTIAFWFKSEWPEPKPGWRRDGVPTKDEIWRSFFFAPSSGPNPGGGTLHFWMWGPKCRLDRHDLDNHLDSGSYSHSTDWRYVVITWDDFGSHMYVNGVSPTKSDSYSPQRQALRSVNPYEFERTAEMFKKFFVGCEGPSCSAIDGLVDDFRIWSRAMDTESVRKLCADVRDVELETSRSFATEGERVKVAASVRSPCGRDLSGARIVLFDTAGARRWESAPLAKAGGREEVELALPHGEYRFRVEAGGRLYGDEAFGVLSNGNPSVLPPCGKDGVPAKMRLVRTVVPDPQALGEGAFRAIGDWRFGELGGRRYLEAGPLAGDRFAIRLALEENVPLHCLEIDYPDDTNRTADVIVQRSKQSGGDYTLQVGYACGAEYPNTGKTLTHRCLYWTRETDVTLVMMTARKGAPAAVSEIRVYAVDGEALPAAELAPAPPVDGRVRHFGSYWEDPAIGSDFATDAATFDGFEKIVDRMAALLKYSGRDMFVYPGSWYHGLIGKNYQPRRHPYRFLQAYYEKFSRQGLYVIPTVNQQTVPFPARKVTVGTMRDGSLHDTSIAIFDTGLPSWGGWHGEPPSFCIFHPDVQAEFEKVVDALVEEGREYPAFKGVCFHLTSITCPWWGGIEAGYNDYVIDAFTRDTGIRVPGDRKDPLRAKAYAAWLKANAYGAWVKWRCDFLTGFYAKLAKKLAAARPDLVLYLNAMPRALPKDPTFMETGYRDRVLREAGIDPEGLTQAIPNLVMGTVAYPSYWRHRGLSTRFRDAAHAARFRLYDADAGYYTLFRPAKYPWLNLHDDYWESPIGASGGKASLTCDWLSECRWRVTCINAAGRQALRPYALALKFNDVLAFSRGGFLVGAYGMEPEMVEFARAFRALPAVKFDDVACDNPDVTVRRKDMDGRRYGYAVNTSGLPQTATVFGRTLELKPYELRMLDL